MTNQPKTYGSPHDVEDSYQAPPHARAGPMISVDDLAQEIRRVDGNHDLGAGALAEALMPFLAAAPSPAGGRVEALAVALFDEAWRGVPGSAWETADEKYRDDFRGRASRILAALSHPVSGGGLGSLAPLVPTEQAETPVVDDRLHDAIRQLRQHVSTIQAAKQASASGVAQGMDPIWNLINALPGIVAQLDMAELEIEAAFERYEDARPAPAVAPSGGA